ncbi:hypothetical protein BHM03_00043925 [Ensete ventricosum]|nr:hypothetical protein BHM03_00043925 [Ensete ventricosum]
MVGVFSLSYLEGDLGLIGSMMVFLHNGPCISPPSRRADSFGHRALDDDNDLLLNGPLQSWGWVSGPLDIMTKVPMVNELFYLIA